MYVHNIFSSLFLFSSHVHVSRRNSLRYILSKMNVTCEFYHDLTQFEKIGTEMLPSSKNMWNSAYYYNDDNQYAFYRTTAINLENASKPVKPEKVLRFVPRSSKIRSESPQRKIVPRRIRLTEYQETVLEDQFKRWPKAPHTGDVVLLAAETGLSEDDVQDWYAMRLIQWRKEQGLGGSLGLH